MIIVKQHTSVQLAHLYEHLFCSRVNKLLYQRGLFPYLDYSLIGRTYHQGVVFIDLLSYTPKADKLSRQIDGLDINTSEKSITLAMSQMLAEDEYVFESSGYDTLKKELEGLHAQVWQNLDDVDFIDVRNARIRTGPLRLVKEKVLIARKLTIDIGFNATYAKECPELMPLVRQIILLISANLRLGLAERFGYYSVASKYKNTIKGVRMRNIFHVASGQAVDLNQVVDAYLDEATYLQKKGAFKRLLGGLQKVSYTNHPYLAPNSELNFKDTHYFVGSEGWKIIATKENCDAILRNISASILFDGKKVLLEKQRKK